MAPEGECEKEMFVTIRWERDGLAVPLSQLTPISATAKQTKQAVEDWNYWVQMGYQFAHPEMLGRPRIVIPAKAGIQ